MNYNILLALNLSIIFISNQYAQENNIGWKDILYQESNWYKTNEFRIISDNLLIYQHSSGGWPKNIDMSKKISNKEKDSILRVKNKRGTSLSFATIDNDATITQLYLLAHSYKNFGLQKYKLSFVKGIKYLIEAQYENGGWPQYYPLRSGYYEQITFNDNAIYNVMKLLFDITNNIDLIAPLKLNDKLLKEVNRSFSKGVNCILNTQIIKDKRLTVWCAQHDKIKLIPTKGRSYELESFSGSESANLVLLLMRIRNPDTRIIASIEGAVKWFELNKIEGKRIVNKDDKYGRKNKILINDKNAPLIWARFYDLKSEHPFFCSRDGIKKRFMSEISFERRNGYRWYTDAPIKVLNAYKKWILKN